MSQEPQTRVVRVVVASTSEAKVAAVREAFAAALGGAAAVETVAVAVPSGVRAQPVGADETLRGACNRLRAAAARVPAADYYAAIEGGVAPPPACAALVPPPRPAALSAIAFAAVAHREAGDASSRSSSESVLRVSVVPAPAFPLPRALCERVGAGGEELGVACGHVFAGHDGKGSGGAVGCLTRGGVSRAQLYAPAVRLALVPFVGPALAFDLPTLAP